MVDKENKVHAILRVGKDASNRGQGSLRDALARVDYTQARQHLGAEDLVEVLQKHEGIIEDWVAYSEDKRTSAGWYLKRTGEIGRLDDPRTVQRFGSMEQAVAENVLKELDYWAVSGSETGESKAPRRSG